MSTPFPPAYIAPENSGAVSTLPPAHLPPIIKATSLLSTQFPPQEELVEGMLHVGSTMVYGGGSKTNKTFALMDLAVSVSAGVPWWDMQTTQGKVLYLNFELKDQDFQKRLRPILAAKSLTQSQIDDLDLWNLRGRAADISELIGEIIRRMRDKNYKMIIIDPIYKVLGNRDENAAGDINSLMNELERLAVECGCAVVVGHHFSKGGQAGKNSLDRISGSGVFARSADAIVTITKHEENDVYTVESTLRSFKAMDAFCVKWTYPLMVRDEAFDPAKLNSPGTKKTQYTGEQLLKILGREELTHKEWKHRTIKKHSMSERTFAERKKGLLEDELIEEIAGGKWKAKANDLMIDTRTKIDLTPAEDTPDAAAAKFPAAALMNGAV